VLALFMLRGAREGEGEEGDARPERGGDTGEEGWFCDLDDVVGAAILGPGFMLLVGGKNGFG
jgi:hypothetical protein